MQSRNTESKEHLVNSLDRRKCGKRQTSMIRSPELMPPGPSCLPQIHPERDLCSKHSVDALDLPVCKDSIIIAKLSTQSHSHTMSKATPASNPAAGLICKEINGLRRARGRLPTLNQCKQHKLLQKWVHSRKSIASSSHPLTEHVPVSLQINHSSQMNLYRGSRCCSKYHIHINSDTL